MIKIHVIAVGRLQGPERELCAEYAKRIKPAPVFKEIPTSQQKSEHLALLAALPPKAYVVCLDERGKDLSSREFAGQIEKWQNTGVGEVAFLLGGADGFLPELKSKAQLLLGLGRKTWPHKLARIMLFEQIYRAQQILAGHPYHRD